MMTKSDSQPLEHNLANYFTAATYATSLALVIVIIGWATGFLYITSIKT